MEDLVVRGVISREQFTRGEKLYAEDCRRNPWRSSFVDFVKRQWSLAPDQVKLIDEVEETRRNLLKTPALRGVLDDIREGRAILFVGAGFSLPSPPDAARQGLTGEQVKVALLNDLSFNGKHSDEVLERLRTLSLAQVALFYRREFDSPRLNERLLELCLTHFPTLPLRQHKLLATLNCFRFIITTNWDRLIEDGFRAHSPNRSNLEVITHPDQLKHLSLTATNLIKVHGDLNVEQRRWDREPKVTEDDFLGLEQSEPALYSLLKTLFLSHRIIVTGFYPQDYNLVRLLQFAVSSLPDKARSLTLVNPDPHVSAAMPVQQPDHIKTTAANFLQIVQTYITHVGGNAGLAFRNPLRHVGAPEIWAKQHCDSAKRVLNLFPTLQHVEVVGHRGGNGDQAARAVQSRAASVLAEYVRFRSSLALSCGTTLHGMVEQLDVNDGAWSHLRIASTTVTMMDEYQRVSPTGLIGIMAERLERWNVKAKSCQLPSRFVHAVHSREITRFLTASPEVNEDAQQAACSVGSDILRSYLREAAASDVFCLGVGAVCRNGTALGDYGIACLRETLRASGRLAQPLRREELLNQGQAFFNQLAQRGAFVGDVLYRFFRQAPEEHGEGLAAGPRFFTLPDLLHLLEEFRSDGADSIFLEWVARLWCHSWSIEPEDLIEATEKRKPVMLVASGDQKAAAVRDLLRIGIGSVLVIDENLCDELLSITKGLRIGGDAP
ncbi:MAG: SIR2 family protein [Planctomycetes bacterium]|nr:SIR2 family protein [Planctomycetota bacterium]